MTTVYDWNRIEPERLTQTFHRRIALGDHIGVARLEAGKGSVKSAHSHPHEEIIILLRGKWRFRFPSGDVTLSADQLLTIPPDVEHSSEVLEDVVAIEVCSPPRTDWLNGEDHSLHHDPDQWLWGV